MDYSNKNNVYYNGGAVYGGQGNGYNGGAQYQRVDMTQVLAMQGLVLDNYHPAAQRSISAFPTDEEYAAAGYGGRGAYSPVLAGAENTNVRSARYSVGSAQDEASYNVDAPGLSTSVAHASPYCRGSVLFDNNPFSSELPDLDYDDACSLTSEDFDNPSLDIKANMSRAQLVAEMVSTAFETGYEAGREDHATEQCNPPNGGENTVTINYPPNTTICVDVTLDDGDGAGRHLTANDRVANWIEHNPHGVVGDADVAIAHQAADAESKGMNDQSTTSKGKEIAPRLQGGALARHNENARKLSLRPALKRNDTSSSSEAEAECIQCRLCDRSCGSVWELNMHIKLVHTEQLCCPHGNCTYYTQRNNELITHLTAHGDTYAEPNTLRTVRPRVRFDSTEAGPSKPASAPSRELRRKRAILCKYCDELFMGEGALARREQHVSKEHPNEALETYKTKLHELEANTPHATCDHCGKVYRGPTADDMLHKHMQHRHSKRALTTTYCKVCGKVFEGVGSEKVYADHVRVMHPTHYTCAECSFTTSSKNKLRRHEKKHDIRYRYKCSYCDEDFEYLDRQRAHMRYVHSNELLHGRAEDLEVESVHSSDGDDLYGP